MPNSSKIGNRLVLHNSFSQIDRIILFSSFEYAFLLIKNNETIGFPPNFRVLSGVPANGSDPVAATGTFLCLVSPDVDNWTECPDRKYLTPFDKKKKEKAKQSRKHGTSETGKADKDSRALGELPNLYARIFYIQLEVAFDMQIKQNGNENQAFYLPPTPPPPPRPTPLPYPDPTQEEILRAQAKLGNIYILNLNYQKPTKSKYEGKKEKLVPGFPNEMLHVTHSPEEKNKAFAKLPSIEVEEIQFLHIFINTVYYQHFGSLPIIYMKTKISREECILIISSFIYENDKSNCSPVDYGICDVLAYSRARILLYEIEVEVGNTKREKKGTPNLSAVRQGEILSDSRSKEIQGRENGNKGPKDLELYPKSNGKISKEGINESAMSEKRETDDILMEESEEEIKARIAEWVAISFSRGSPHPEIEHALADSLLRLPMKKPSLENELDPKQSLFYKLDVQETYPLLIQKGTDKTVQRKEYMNPKLNQKNFGLCKSEKGKKKHQTRSLYLLLLLLSRFSRVRLCVTP
ncbi:hypothetical protein MG293_001718 [Ovis ammon polii]|uniref:Uncharacterized protein n=1 Tax=Ovis ammon polii TaxID=230172 RepID=A0AAD4YID9_OVIAM|nr:hypothetical protein MG293_001718 [Ovis ammon polii]